MHNRHIVGLEGTPYYDAEIAAAIDRKERADTRRAYNRLVKEHGGSWKCRGGCGKTISANKFMCRECLRREAEIDALGRVEEINSVDRYLAPASSSTACESD